jgi:hypothetical protein
VTHRPSPLSLSGTLLLFLSVLPGLAQSSDGLPERGHPEWVVNAGYGFSVHINRGTSNESLFLFDPQVGFRWGSRTEYLVEGHFAQYFTPKGFAVGILPLGARYFLGQGAVAPYVSGGAGFGWTDLTNLDEIDRRFNFFLQAGLGVRGSMSGNRAWSLEARLLHYSNAGTVPPNLGLNSLVLLVGWRIR